MNTGRLIRIVVPCGKSDGTLGECLGALLRSRGIDAEIVLVDDGMTHALQVPTGKFPISTLTTVGGIGAGAARNLGARGFGGSVLVFVDADVEIASADTIAALIAPIVRGEAEATVGSYVASGGGGVCAAYKQCYLAYTYGKETADLRNTFWTALSAVERSWFEASGGFSESYAGAGPEDLDFGITLTGRQGRIRSVPAAQGYHRSPMTLWKLLCNDLRKGSEDVYVHWTRRIPLTNNRHAGLPDICAVLTASAFLVLVFPPPMIGVLPPALCGGLYLALRSGLIVNAYWNGSISFVLLSGLLTFVLDIVRAGAVITGSALAGLEALFGRRVNPFLRR